MFSKSKISDFSSLPERTIEVFIYILILLILGYWLKDFFKMSWQYGLIQSLLPYYVLSYIVVIIAGAYYGVLIVTLVRDDFKRIQGILLLLISIYVTYYYNHFFYNNFLFFIVSFASVSLYAYKKIKPSSCRYKYENELLTIVSNLTILFIIISLISYFGGYFQTYQTFPESSTYYLIFTGIFIFVFHNFMKHETSQSDIFVIGPPRIGKTVFMSALCDIVNGDANPPLRKARDKMIYKNERPDPTDKLDEFEFSFPKGFLFTKCMTISTYDYPGIYAFEDLQTIFEWLYTKKREENYSSFKELIDNIKIKEGPPLDTIEDIEKIVNKIATSSKLIFLISAVSINGEDEDMKSGKFQGRLKDYVGMYQLFAAVIDKPFLVVVTKIDKAYEINMQYSVSMDKVADTVLNDLRNMPILKDRRIVTRSSLPIFPCWVEIDNGKPKIENGQLVTIGYHDVIKQL
jgi:hypothetical protein